MSIYELAKKRRTIRAFQQKPIPYEILHKIVEIGQTAPSAMNKQPLEYIIVDDAAQVNTLFEHTNWAGYLPREIGRPTDETKPVAFVAILTREDLTSKWTIHDVGASVQNMILAALEEGIGACWIASVQRDKAANILNVPNTHYVDCVLALGYPAETPIGEVLTDSIKYYKDENGTLHVPKRALDTVLHHNKF